MNELRFPFRDDWFLAENLRAQGLTVQLAVTRTDGAELGDADQRTVRAAVVALAAADKDIYQEFARANAAKSSARMSARTKTPKRADAKRPVR